MIYLSRLMLNARSRQAQSEWRDPYQMHKTLARGFPGLSKEEYAAARVLFRVEEADKGEWCLLVQSKIAPDWSALCDIPHYLHRPPQSKEWVPRFESWQRLRFRLLANPTFRKCAEGPVRKAPGNAPRRGLFREAERLDWLKNQAAQHGFELTLQSMTWRGTPQKPFWFRGHAHTNDFTLELPLVTMLDLNDGRRFALPHGDGQRAFSAAQFDGVLSVREPGLFAQAIEKGIGSAKGFGFGLLSVARV
jgi:CRISPR system Cascade subunit CasE